MTNFQYKSSMASLCVVLNQIQNSHKVNSKPYIMQIWVSMFFVCKFKINFSFL